MPADKNTTAQHYVVRLAAGVAVSGASPVTPGRNLLSLQNTGVNPAFFRFEKSATNTGDSIILIPGDPPLVFSSPCPIQSLNFLSVLGTSVTVIEGVHNG